MYLNKKNTNEILEIIKKIDINKSNLSILLDIQYCLYFFMDVLEKQDVYNKIYKYIKDAFNKLFITSKLYDENQVIGIYGYSDDCEMFFDIARNIFGEFKCKFIYIQTKTNVNDKKNNIYNIKEINGIHLNATIIGSIFYENQIKNQINECVKLFTNVYSLKDDLGYYNL